MAYEGMGNVEQAIEEYATAVRLNPDDAYAQSRLGELLRAIGRPEEAIVAFEAAVRIAPDDMFAFCLLADTYREIGRITDAISAFGKVLKIKPDHFYAFMCLGELYLLEGKLDMAAREFEESLAVAPKERRTQRGLARVRIAQRDYDAAISLYQDVLSENQGDMGAHFELGMVYEQLGRLEDAVRELQEAARLDPSNHKVRRRLRSIQALSTPSLKKGVTGRQET